MYWDLQQVSSQPGLSCVKADRWAPLAPDMHCGVHSHRPVHGTAVAVVGCWSQAGILAMIGGMTLGPR